MQIGLMTWWSTNKFWHYTRTDLEIRSDGPTTVPRTNKRGGSLDQVTAWSRSTIRCPYPAKRMSSGQKILIPFLVGGGTSVYAKSPQFSDKRTGVMSRIQWGHNHRTSRSGRAALVYYYKKDSIWFYTLIAPQDIVDQWLHFSLISFIGTFEGDVGPMMWVDQKTYEQHYWSLASAASQASFFDQRFSVGSLKTNPWFGFSVRVRQRLQMNYGVDGELVTYRRSPE